MNTLFEDLNDHIVFTKVKSRSEAVGLRGKVKDIVDQGKTVVIFFDNRYHLQLAPGQDPYQVRKDIDAFVNPPKDKPKGSTETKPKIEASTKNAPPRGAGGKFISKKKQTESSILVHDSPTTTEPSKKKTSGIH